MKRILYPGIVLLLGMSARAEFRYDEQAGARIDLSGLERPSGTPLGTPLGTPSGLTLSPEAYPLSARPGTPLGLSEPPAAAEQVSRELARARSHTLPTRLVRWARNEPATAGVLAGAFAGLTLFGIRRNRS